MNDERHREYMEEHPVDGKVWTVPAHLDKKARMAQISDWLPLGDEDWVGEDQ